MGIFGMCVGVWTFVSGRVYMKNLFWAHPEDSYTARGGSISGEVWTPKFTEHGFRYVQLTVVGGALPSEPTMNTLVGVNYRTVGALHAFLPCFVSFLVFFSPLGWHFLHFCVVHFSSI
jgi:hypothetical protein